MKTSRKIKMSRNKRYWILVFLFPLMIACGGSDEREPIAPSTDEVRIPTGEPFSKLSDYRFFTGSLRQLSPNKRVVPYDLNMPLFSDYLSKKRFIYVPEGSVTPYNESGVLAFPVGTVLIKNFYYNRSGTDHLVETRLLIRNTSGWQPLSYIWNEAQTEAERSIIGDIVPITMVVNGTSRSINYQVPNQNQCVNCHSPTGSLDVLGPKVANLNKDYSYTSGTDNQISHWAEQGILAHPGTSSMPQWPKMSDTSADLNTRARAYLDVNCASCHSPQGSANNSGLFLGYDNSNPSSLGIYKMPVAAGNGSGGLMYDIVPGSADESILLFRMNSSDAAIRMPEIGRELVHEEGVDLIREWIDGM